MVTIEDVRAAIQQLGLSEQAVCVHSSLRSFGQVVGGADTIVDGWLAEGCTVLVPTFAYAFAIAPPLNMRPPRNGWDYDMLAERYEWGIDQVYTPERNEIDRGMGAIPAAVLARSERMRGDHPLNQFAAIGPLAHDLIDAQTPIEVYAPFRKLIERDGFVVMMGVSYTNMTLLHYAEELAGRTLFRRWANDRAGQPTMVAVGSCSEGFDRFAPFLDPIKRTATVGSSTWAIFPARATIDAAVQAIRRDSSITHCADPDCERCNDAVAGGPILA